MRVQGDKGSLRMGGTELTKRDGNYYVICQ